MSKTDMSTLIRVSKGTYCLRDNDLKTHGKTQDQGKTNFTFAGISNTLYRFDIAFEREIRCFYCVRGTIYVLCADGDFCWTGITENQYACEREYIQIPERPQAFGSHRLFCPCWVRSVDPKESPKGGTDNKTLLLIESYLEDLDIEPGREIELLYYVDGVLRVSCADGEIFLCADGEIFSSEDVDLKDYLNKLGIPKVHKGGVVYRPQAELDYESEVDCE